MPEPTDEEKKAAADKEAADKAAKEAEDAAEAAKNVAKGLTPEDRASLEAVVAKERAATRAAEKAAREAQKKLDDIAAQSLTETEKLKKEAEDGKALATAATDKLRRANLMAALHDAGVQNVKAAVRLLDGVEYDDSDEPKNLDDAVKSAKAEFGEQMFQAIKPGPANINGGGGNGAPSDGPSLTADEWAAATAAGMSPEEFKHYQDPKAGPFKAPAST